MLRKKVINMLAYSLRRSGLHTLTSRLFALLHSLLFCCCLLLISACSHEDGSGSDEAAAQPYSEFDSDSWQTRIPDSCSRFFDGCNQCRRTPGTVQATCTRKACVRYLEPKCLDEDSAVANVAEQEQPKKEDYLCDGNNQFSIYYGTYLTEVQRLKLTAEEVMLADRQSLSAYKLTKKMLGSVVVFTDGKFALQSLGDEVQITLENELLYTNCKLRETTL